MKKKKLLTDRSGLLYEQQIEHAAKLLAEDVDFQVMTQVLVESGWTKVVLNPMTAEQGSEIDKWVEKNVKGNVDTRGLVWIFKEPKEANWFKLRWLS